MLEFWLFGGLRGQEGDFLFTLSKWAPMEHGFEWRLAPKNIQKGVFWAIWPKSKRLALGKWLSGSQPAC
jgi:hypothetical protein